MLDVVDLSVSFGGLRALDGVSFRVDSGEILGLIGPNGSGKTTAFNVISGAIKSSGGSVAFLGDDITGLPPHRVSHLGISRTFQIPRAFPELTALETVLAGRLFGGKGAQRDSTSIGFARSVLERVELGAKANVKAADFTVLERKWLEVARALAAEPRLLLLDEFMAGISPSEVPAAIDLVKSINESGVTVVVVEHIIKAITGACSRVIVLDAGQKLAEGTVSEIVENPAVIEAYLGARHAQG